MIFKILNSFVIVGCSTLLGINIANKCVLRCRAIRIFQSTIIQLESEILYYDTLLPEALKHVGSSTTGDIGQFFNWVGDKLNERMGYSVADVWKAGLNEYKKSLNLHQEELELMVQFGEQLGISDKEGQRKYFQLILSQLKTQETKADETRAKYEKMYKSLGFLGGLALAIILL